MSLNENKVSPSQNIYAELGKLSPEIADRITTAKTNGGRSLNALWALDISSTHKLIMVYLGSKIDFTRNFVDEYESISLTEIFNQTSCSKNTVLRVINGYTEKTKDGEKRILGLIEMGYIRKITPKKSDCIQNHIPNQYCLTSKAFDEYMIKMLEWEKIKDSDSAQKPSRWSFFHQDKKKTSALSADTPLIVESTPSPTMALGVVPEWHQGTSHHGTSASAMVGHYFPIPPHSSPIIPVCEEKPIIKKNKSSAFKTKHTQDNKLNRLQINLSLAICESLRLKFVSNDLCGEVLKTVFKETGISIDQMIDIIDDIKNYRFLKSDRKADLIDCLKTWINSKEIMIQKIKADQKKYEDEMIEQEKRFSHVRENFRSDEITAHSMQTEFRAMESNIVTLLPENIKNWYNNLRPISKKSILKEIKDVGIDTFVHKRFPVIERNKTLSKFINIIS